MRWPIRIRSIVVLFAMLLLAVVFMAVECECNATHCTITNSDGHACVYLRMGDGSDVVCGGSGPNGGGGSGGPPTSRTWVLLPGCCDVFTDRGGTPDHHTGGGDSHAVDIGIYGAYCDENGWCTPNCGGVCPDVFYYDNSNSVSQANIAKFDTSCWGGNGGGQRVQFDLFSVDPPGQAVGHVRYLHLDNAAPAGATVSNGTRLGTVSWQAGWACWTGPHLHQQIEPFAPATLEELVGPGQNCESNGPAIPSVPCYAVSW